MGTFLFASGHEKSPNQYLNQLGLYTFGDTITELQIHWE